MWSNGERYLNLPIMIDELSDGFYVINAIDEYKDLIGEKVDTLNGVPVEELVEKFERISNSESEYWSRSGAIDKLHDIYFYKLVDLPPKDDNIITLNGRDVRTIGYYDLSYAEWEIPLSVGNCPNFLVWSIYTDETPYKEEWYEDDKLLVIRFSSCQTEIDGYGLVAFGKDVKEAVMEKKPIALLIDLRENGGGSSAALYTAFSEKFFREGNFINSPNFYIATDNQTFSAGVTTAHFVKEKWGATHIGTPTGGSPFTTNVSTTAQKVLKNSKLLFRVSSEKVRKKMVETPSEIPDVEIKRTVEDILDGSDPVIEYVISEIK